MKRFVAFLLALLLPISAMAETIAVTMQLQTADILFSMLLSPSAHQQNNLGGISMESLVKFLQSLIGDTRFTFVTQEDADAVSLSLNGTNFLDVTTYHTGNEMLMTSSLIPGYVLVEDAVTDTVLDIEENQKIAEDVEHAMVTWLDTIVVETAEGEFSGDAYSGGTSCTTYTITDIDFAALMSSVMTPELRAVIKREAGSTEGDSILEGFDAANARVAEENRYTYTIQMVKDDKAQIIGLSFIVLDQEKQVATISVGKVDKGLRIVVGLGLKKTNYWAECILTQSNRAQTTFLKGELREWTAGKNESFAHVAENNAPVMSYLLNCISTKSGQRNLWDGHMYLGDKTDAVNEILSFSGSVNNADQSVEAKFTLLANRQELMNFSLSKKKSAAILPPDATMVRCSENDPDQGELYTKVSQNFIFAITMQLMQLIPFDILLKMDGLMP